MTMKKTGDWDKALKILGGYAKHTADAIEMATAWEAANYMAEVDKAFVKGGLKNKWPALSPLTIMLRQAGAGGAKSKGTKPLIRTGQLRRSINMTRMGWATYFVGVHRRTRAKGGAQSVNIARMHEEGRIIPVTSGVRRYFMYLFLKGLIPAPLKAGTKYLHIPQRSFLREPFEEIKKGAQLRILKKIDEILFALVNGLPLERPRDKQGRFIKMG